MKSAEAGFSLDSKNLNEGQHMGRGYRTVASPEEQMLSVCYIQVSRILLNVCIAELWFGHTKPIRGECRMCNEFIWSYLDLEIQPSVTVQHLNSQVKPLWLIKSRPS